MPSSRSPPGFPAVRIDTAGAGDGSGPPQAERTLHPCSYHLRQEAFAFVSRQGADIVKILGLSGQVDTSLSLNTVI